MAENLKKDPYRLLGVSRDADDEVVKAAYRALSRKYHPDINKSPDAESVFKAINNAYEIIKSGGQSSSRSDTPHCTASACEPVKPQWLQEFGRALDRAFEVHMGKGYDGGVEGHREVGSTEPGFRGDASGPMVGSLINVYRFISNLRRRRNTKWEAKP